VDTPQDHSASALVVEEDKAQRVQAQFTRLRMALGFKKSLTDEGKLLGYECFDSLLMTFVIQNSTSLNMESS
jgi:hypothetical protein